MTRLFVPSCKGCLLESVISGCLWSAMTHFGRTTSSIGIPGLIQDVNYIGIPGLIQDVNYLYLVVGPFSLLACLAALLSAFNLVLLCLSSCSSCQSATAGRRARFSGILNSRRHHRCLYGQAQELKLWSRVYSSISTRSRERSWWSLMSGQKAMLQVAVSEPEGRLLGWPIGADSYRPGPRPDPPSADWR